MDTYLQPIYNLFTTYLLPINTLFTIEFILNLY